MSPENQKKPVNYQNGKIYMITNTINEKIYIGSTVTKLSIRFNNHKNEARNNNENINRIFYDFFRDNINCFEIKLIENYPCNSKRELENREYEIIQEFVLKEGTEKLYNLCLARNGAGHTSFGENNPMFGKKGEKNPAFNFGCICEEKDKNTYRFYWYVLENNENKKTSKNFNFNKYGSKENAYKAALEFQKQIYPQLNKNNNDN